LANGALLVTVPPIGSAQDQALLAARMALLIKERWPDAVVSMATGRGAVKGHTAVGEVVDLAARAWNGGVHPSAEKPTTGVLIDSLSAKLLEGRFAKTPCPDGALLHYEEPDVDASRPLLGKPTPCVGRDAELSNLDAQLHSCIEESEARVALITAPPGVGKSRLRHEFLRRVEKRSESITVLLGRGDIMSSGAPYGILRAALHKLCGILENEPLKLQRERLRTRVGQNLPGATAERVVLFIGELCNLPFPEAGRPELAAARQDPKIMRDCVRRGFLDFLAAECAAGPVLVVLDDLQWADELTVSVLDESLHEQSGAPLFVLAFARSGIHEIFPKLWSGHKLLEIPLKGLSHKACERLIERVLGKGVAKEVLARVIAQSAGNALYLEEMIRTIAEGQSIDRPETVLAMLQARVGHLDSAVGRAVRAAAVFGESFFQGGVAAILGLPKDDSDVEHRLNAAMNAELIQPTGKSRQAKEQEYRFRHGLLRDAAYALLASADRELGHRLACTYLVQVGERDPAVLAEHAYLARDLERAVTFYQLAAEAACQHGDLAGAVKKAERCIASGAHGETLGRMLAIKTEFCTWRHDWQAGCELATAAHALLPRGSRWWCQNLASLAMMAANMNRTDFLGLVVENLRDCEPQPDAVAAYCYCVSYLISLFSMLGVRAVADDFMAHLRSLEPTLREDDALAISHIDHANWNYSFYFDMSPWDFYKHAQRAIQALEQTRDHRLRITARIREGLAYLSLGDYALAEQTLRLANESAARQEDGFLLTLSQVYYACFAAERCELEKLEETEVIAKQIISRNEMDATVGNGWGSLARVRLAQGRLSEARAAAEQALATLKNQLGFRPRVYRTLLQVLLQQEDLPEVSRILHEVEDCLRGLGGAGAIEVALRLSIAEAYAAIGQKDAADSMLAAVLRLIDRAAARIPDPSWRQRYLSTIPENVRARELMELWSQIR
jgi:hypothetical protein